MRIPPYQRRLEAIIILPAQYCLAVRPQSDSALSFLLDACAAFPGARNSAITFSYGR